MQHQVMLKAFALYRKEIVFLVYLKQSRQNAVPYKALRLKGNGQQDLGG